MINKTDFRKLQLVLGYVWGNHHSNFYKEKYRRSGINLTKVKNCDDFQKIPFLTRQEIIDTDPYDRNFLPLEKSPDIFLSSGTTNSSNPMIIFYAAQHALQQKITLETPLKLKLKCIIQLNPVLSSQFKMRQGYGKFRIFLADTNNLDITAKIASNLKIDGIRSTPSGLYNFLPYLKKNYDLINIRYVFLSGEYCSSAKLKVLKGYLPKAVIEFGFASNETAHLGYRCRYLANSNPQLFHPLPIFHYEVDQTEGKDELIVTHLFKETAFPVIRYRTGNSVKFKEKKCRCGNGTIMEVFGRIGLDVVSFGGVMLYNHEILKALKPISDLLATTDYQAHVFEKVNGHSITYSLKLQLVPSGKINSKLAEELTRQIEKNLAVSSKFTFTDLITRRVLDPLEIEFVASLPSSYKARPIISHIS